MRVSDEELKPVIDCNPHDEIAAALRDERRENDALRQRVASLQYAMVEDDKAHEYTRKKLAERDEQIAKANTHAEKAYALSEQYARERDAAMAALRELYDAANVRNLLMPHLPTCHSLTKPGVDYWPQCDCGELRYVCVLDEVDAALSGVPAAQDFTSFNHNHWCSDPAKCPACSPTARGY